MDLIWQIAAYSIPAIIVFLVAYFILRSYLNKEYKLRLIEYRHANLREALPIRLQAYERLTVLLERISLNNLLPRVRQADMKVSDFRQALISNIRLEFEHNISQQIYVSAEAWGMIKVAREEIISIINRNVIKIPPELHSVELSKNIINELAESQEESSVQRAILQLKKEVLLLYEN